MVWSSVQGLGVDPGNQPLMPWPPRLPQRRACAWSRTPLQTLPGAPNSQGARPRPSSLFSCKTVRRGPNGNSGGNTRGSDALDVCARFATASRECPLAGGGVHGFHIDGCGRSPDSGARIRRRLARQSCVRIRRRPLPSRPARCDGPDGSGKVARRKVVELRSLRTARVHLTWAAESMRWGSAQIRDLDGVAYDRG